MQPNQTPETPNNPPQQNNPADNFAPVSSNTPTPANLPEQPSQPVPPTSNVPSSNSNTPIAEQDPPVVPATSPVAGGTEPFTGKPQKSKKGLIAGLIGLLVVILLIAGYIFLIYLPNTPANIYKAGLKNSGQAVDKLASYFNTASSANFESTKASGKLTFQSASVSGEGSIQSQFDKNGNAKGTLKVDVSGQKFSVDFKSIKKASNNSPDIYLKANNVKSLLGSLGLGTLGSLDGQWIEADHTLVDTVVKSAEKSAQTQTNTNINSSGKDKIAIPNKAQIIDAVEKVNQINKKYLFTTDQANAVLKNNEFVGKETKNNRSLNHYKVSYNKDNLQAYIKALGPALDSSKLNDWYKKANDGKSISSALDLSKAASSIKDQKDTLKLDMWVDVKTKLIQSIQFTSTKDGNNNKMILSQNYTGGSVYPFAIELSGKENNSSKPFDAKAGFSIDTDQNKYTFNASYDQKASASGSFNLAVTESNDKLNVAAPNGAKSINDIMQQLGLGANGLSSSSYNSSKPVYNL